MHLLVLSERNLCRVEADVDAAFIRPQRTAVIACADGTFTGKVGLWVFAVQTRILNICMTKGTDFIARLEGVGVGVIVVVSVVWVAHGEAPTSRRRSRDGLVHTLNPPREELAFREVVGKSERIVGDFRVFPRLELVNAG